MRIDQLNASQICYIKSFVNCECKHYVYKEEIKVLGIVFRKKGFYFTMVLRGDPYRTVEQIESEGVYIIEGKVVYYKPHLEIRMSNQQTVNYFFDTEYELEEFMSRDKMRIINWIYRPNIN